MVHTGAYRLCLCYAHALSLSRFILYALLMFAKDLAIDSQAPLINFTAELG